ncbi:Pentatricopeptide repeat-containing protein [Cynara cardunculus var. scolymus]|uniref:Pentatricopeptide repeat-containing protein n=1 Tax=Cynara cardunculus var. scolymus TaxID=59895 RepID=A0A103WHX4_CYNCS|nr:Pentatricopeptide repeat-containing protein [Cynara cardunculus var. scolymus]
MYLKGTPGTSSPPSLYSFLQPSIFAVRNPQVKETPNPDDQTPKPTAVDNLQKPNLESTLQLSLQENNIDEAWKCFKSLSSSLPKISRKTGRFCEFLEGFNENCRIAKEEKLDSLRPDLAACNAALEGCCHELESVTDAQKVLDTMFVLGVHPDETSNFESISAAILRRLRELDGKVLNFLQGTYGEIVKGYLTHGSIKGLASLILEAQKLESTTVIVEKCVGYGIISACVNLGLLEKANNILDEMNAHGGSVGLGVYVSILKAYGKEQRTAEAASWYRKCVVLG